MMDWNVSLGLPFVGCPGPLQAVQVRVDASQLATERKDETPPYQPFRDERGAFGYATDVYVTTQRYTSATVLVGHVAACAVLAKVQEGPELR